MGSGGMSHTHTHAVSLGLPRAAPRTSTHRLWWNESEVGCTRGWVYISIYLIFFVLFWVCFRTQAGPFVDLLFFRRLSVEVGVG